MRISQVIVLPLVGLIAFLSACDSAKVYQDFVDFDEVYWHQDSTVTFAFEVEDTSLKYNMQALFRNSLAYPYHNMYYRYKFTGPSDSLISEDLMQIYLFDPKTGEPYGSGVGDMFDQKQALFENYSFDETGMYKIELQQAMRLDTLPFIYSVGWRVENAQ